MIFDKIPRRLHQQRAGRLEARDPQAIAPPLATAPVLQPAPLPAPQPVAQDAGKHALKPTPVLPPPPPPPPPVVPPSPILPPLPPPGAGPIPITTLTSTPVTSTSSILSTPVSTSALPVVTSVNSLPTDSQDDTTDITTPTFRSLPPAQSISASPSASAAPSSSSKSSPVVGAVIGGIAAVAIVGVLGFWILKRYLSSRDDKEVAGDNAWMRSSVAIPDNPPSSVAPRGNFGPSETPRPPTMIERRQMHNYNNVSPQYPQGGMEYPVHPYGVPNFGPGYPALGPSQMQGFPSPIAPASPPSPGIASMDETMPPMQHASGVYFSRHDSNMSNAIAESVVLEDMPNPHGDGYAQLDRTSVTPYQAQQYEEISRQLSTQHPMEAISEGDGDPVMAQARLSGQEGFAQGPPPPPPSVSPFADPAAAMPDDMSPPTLPPMRAMSPVDPAGVNKTFIQIADEFPAAPTSPVTRAFSPPVASSPRSATFPTSSAAGGVGGPLAGPPRTPVQAGFSQPAVVVPSSPTVAHAPPAAAAAAPPAAKARSVRETAYNDEDAYGGI